MFVDNIPKSFNVFGQTISIKNSKTLHRKGDRGDWDPKKNRITLQSNTKEYPVTKDLLEQTLSHEAVHAILELLGYERLSEDEVFVDRFANALHQAVKTAKY